MFQEDVRQGFEVLIHDGDKAIGAVRQFSPHGRREPGLGIIASLVMLGFGLWWLGRAEVSGRKKGEGYGAAADFAVDAPEDQLVRDRATTSSSFDPAEVRHGHQSDSGPPIALAFLPLGIVVGVNLLMSLFVLPRLDASYLADQAWGSTSLSAVRASGRLSRRLRLQS